MKKKTEIEEIVLSTPWNEIPQMYRSEFIDHYGEDEMGVLNPKNRSTQSERFIAVRSLIHKKYIEEGEKNKRILWVLSTIAMIFGVSVICFSPSDSSTKSLVAGAIMISFGLSMYGYTFIKLKLGRVEVTASGINENKSMQATPNGAPDE